MNRMPDSRLLPCPSCGATNRVPEERLARGQTPVCGKCKTPLPTQAKPLIATDKNFAQLVESTHLPVLVDFWAAWCGPCRMIAPMIDQLAGEFAGRAIIAKLNVDENPVTASRFGVRSIPTLLIIRDGREVDRIVGAPQKSQILQRLAAAL